MDSGQNPVVPLQGADFVGKEIIHVDLNSSANYKIREPTGHFGGKVKHENFIPESTSPNIIESFLTSRNAATTCCPR